MVMTMPIPRTTKATIGAMLLALALAGCDGAPFGPTPCTLELRVEYTPSDTTVSTGSQFDATVALSSCGGREKLRDTFVWSSQDADVARVDALSGRVTAVSPGSTTIRAAGKKYGAVGGLSITVTPEP